MKYRAIIADNLSKAGESWATSQQLISEGRFTVCQAKPYMKIR